MTAIAFMARTLMTRPVTQYQITEGGRVVFETTDLEKANSAYHRRVRGGKAPDTVQLICDGNVARTYTPRAKLATMSTGTETAGRPRGRLRSSSTIR